MYVYILRINFKFSLLTLNRHHQLQFFLAMSQINMSASPFANSSIPVVPANLMPVQPLDSKKVKELAKLVDMLNNTLDDSNLAAIAKQFSHGLYYVNNDQITPAKTQREVNMLHVEMMAQSFEVEGVQGMKWPGIVIALDPEFPVNPNQVAVIAPREAKFLGISGGHRGKALDLCFPDEPDKRVFVYEVLHACTFFLSLNLCSIWNNLFYSLEFSCSQFATTLHTGRESYSCHTPKHPSRAQHSLFHLCCGGVYTAQIRQHSQFG